MSSNAGWVVRNQLFSAMMALEETYWQLPSKADQRFVRHEIDACRKAIKEFDQEEKR